MGKMTKYDSPKSDNPAYVVAVPFYRKKPPVRLLIGRADHVCVCGRPKSSRDGREFCRNPGCFMHPNGKQKWWRDIL